MNDMLIISSNRKRYLIKVTVEDNIAKLSVPGKVYKWEVHEKIPSEIRHFTSNEERNKIRRFIMK